MKRVPELDALRAIAAGIVLVFHLRPRSFPFGWTGVDLFFVLSGYLITSIILGHQDSPGFYRNFYMRRGLRIWPIYYLTLIFLVATNPLLDHPQPMGGLPYALTYTQNVPSFWHKPTPLFHKAFDHSWTLALEEQFYLIWPLLLSLISRRRVVPLCLAVVALNFAMRSGVAIYLGIPLVIRAFPERILITRSDGFALGGLLAGLLIDREYVSRHLSRFRQGFGLIFVLASLYLAWGVWTEGATGYLGMPTPPDPSRTILAVNMLYAGLVGLVICYVGHPLLWPLRLRPLAYLGMISYGIYMYHPAVYFFMDGQKFDYDQGVGKNVLKLATTVGVAILSWHLIEKPMLKLKDRFAYDKKPIVEVGQTV